MPRLTIDGKAVSAAEGSTLVQAAEEAGIKIPTLCHVAGVEPLTSCMICVVKELKSGKTLPACSAPAEEGMVVETSNEEIRAARREVLQLLLSEHVGDCEAPCRRMCPAALDIPLMLRLIADGHRAEATVLAKDGLVLPATLGWVCGAPCERGCRRGLHDDPVSIRELHRRAAESDLTQDAALPECGADSGKRVAVVGAGPEGLSAAWVLRRLGHGCTLYEKRSKAGGPLRELPEESLPAEVLDGEIDTVLRMGARLELDSEVGSALSLNALLDANDAVILACGGIEAAGDRVVQAKLEEMCVRAVASGKAAAHRVDHLLAGEPEAGKAYDSRVPLLNRDTVKHYASGRIDDASWSRPRNAENAAEEAARCLHCDCHRPSSCKLRQYATEYGAQPGVYSGGERPDLEVVRQSANVLFEPGKCIKCGLCVEITRETGEKMGLGFVGRGFNIGVAVPFSEALDQGLRVSAQRCVEACPTGALAFPGWEERRPCE